MRPLTEGDVDASGKVGCYAMDEGLHPNGTPISGGVNAQRCGKVAGWAGGGYRCS
jgi:hypothetical protein